MKIVFASSECAPWAKTGGLADVVGALPLSLAELGHQVSIFLPYYRTVARRLPNLPVVIPSLTIPFSHFNRFVRILDGGRTTPAAPVAAKKPRAKKSAPAPIAAPAAGFVQLYLVDSPELFDREALYGVASDYPDNAERFALLSRAVIEATKQLGVPDVYHAHDWQAAMLPVYLRSTYAFDSVLRRTPCVFSIHNAAYQGVFPPRTIETLLLPWDMFTFQRLEQNDRLNFLKGGIVYSDLLSTVSRKYAQEIQTAEFGCGLDSTIALRAADMVGILNGVDYAEWDPAVDQFIAANFTPTRLAGKKQCRADLLAEFGLSDVPASTAVLGLVSRFAVQKGMDFIAAVAPQLLQDDVVLVALGSGDPHYESIMHDLSRRFPHKCRVRIGYDNALAHKIEAGSDIFLMPSRYEPCGLNQIYSLKYGTIPVVRATGGLEDTIDEQHLGKGNGFKFHGYDPLEFLAAVRRALAVRRVPAQWKDMMTRGMRQDFSWHASALEYVKLYQQAIARRSV